MNKRYISYGPGHSGEHVTLKKAQAAVTQNGGHGAVYVRQDVVAQEIAAWASLVNRLANIVIDAGEAGDFVSSNDVDLANEAIQKAVKYL